MVDSEGFIAPHRCQIARKRKSLGGSATGLKVAMGTDTTKNGDADTEYEESEVELSD